MIARVHGLLEELVDGNALLRVEGAPGAGLTYEVLVPAYTSARLAASVGQPVTLHTLHFIESPNQGATMHPRLAGFLSIEDRQFFELFTTCKGIGPRKALRAMTLNTGQIAAAIADRDTATLQTLPEVGRRTAETLVATLRDKVDRFVSASAFGSGAGESRGAVEPAAGLSAVARQALEVLLQLGENRAQAVAWIDQALQAESPPTDVEGLVARVYQIKSGG